MFFISCDNGKTLLFIKVYRFSELKIRKIRKIKKNWLKRPKAVPPKNEIWTKI